MRAALSTLALALTLGLGLVVPPPPATAAGNLAGALVEVLPTPRASFSPNGDGHRDTLPVRFRLAERAHVTVRVRPLDRVIDLGARPAGAQRWVWDGRGAPTGSYRLVVRARTADSRTGQDGRFAEIDRGETLRAVEISMTRRTIYPQTPGKQDAIHVHSTKEGNATGVALLDAAGHVVLRDRFWTWWVWTGEGDDGALLAPGEYDAVFSLRDRFGNRREIHRAVRVSADVLHQETWSSTVAAGDVGQFDGSGDCRTVPSTRFAGGVTVASAGCDRAWFLPRFEIPVPIDPDLTWRLTVTGGPTTPGSTDTASVIIQAEIGATVVETATGDTTTTTPWGGPHPYLWDREPESLGGVMTRDGASYDVAQVTLEVRYWTPSGPRPPGRR